MSVLELFCDVDDFMVSFAPQLQAIQLAAGKQRERQGQLSPARGDDDSHSLSPVAVSHL